MSPAGFSENNDDENAEPKRELTLRPQVTKSLLKGIIAIAVFSLFLNIESNFVNYLIFLLLSFGSLGLYMLYKRSSIFRLGEESLSVKRILGKSNTISYRDIADMSVAQGILARRLKCGSLYLILKQGHGGAQLMGGGSAERLEDIPGPHHVYDLISSRMGPYGA